MTSLTSRARGGLRRVAVPTLLAAVAAFGMSEVTDASEKFSLEFRWCSVVIDSLAWKNFGKLADLARQALGHRPTYEASG